MNDHYKCICGNDEFYDSRQDTMNIVMRARRRKHLICSECKREIFVPDTLIDEAKFKSNKVKLKIKEKEIVEEQKDTYTDLFLKERISLSDQKNTCEIIINNFKNKKCTVYINFGDSQIEEY